MTRDSFRTCLRKLSARLPHTPVSGMEWKRNGRGMEVGHPHPSVTGRRPRAAWMGGSAANSCLAHPSCALTLGYQWCTCRTFTEAHGADEAGGVR